MTILGTSVELSTEQIFEEALCTYEVLQSFRGLGSFVLKRPRTEGDRTEPGMQLQFMKQRLQMQA